MLVAKEQARIVVTRDRHILERRVVTTGQVGAILIMSDDFREQMQQVTGTLGLNLLKGFSLCIECNEALRSISKDMVMDRVPPFVFSTQDQFYECLKCGRLYWRGTHWCNMRAELAGFAEGA